MNYWNEWEGFGQEYPDQAPPPEEQQQPGWYPEQGGPYEMYGTARSYTQIRSAQTPERAEPTQQATRKNYPAPPLAAPIELTRTPSKAPKAPQLAAFTGARSGASWWKQQPASPMELLTAGAGRAANRAGGLRATEPEPTQGPDEEPEDRDGCGDGRRDGGY
jgi:hypothetical protein